MVRAGCGEVWEVLSEVANEVLAAVRELLPDIAARAEWVDESRRLPADVVGRLTESGVFRMLQPRRYGGAECDPGLFYEVIRELSGACGSTGWVASVLGVHPWHLALFPDAAQKDVWGADPDALVCSAYAPIGRLEPVEGGFELSGKWQFSSGCDHASWALLGAMVIGAEGRPVDFLTVLVPRSDYVVNDVWDVVGMRGTGSNEIVVGQAYVPEHRVKRNYETTRLVGPGQKVNRGPLYRLPFGTIFTTAVTVPIVGTVAGCFDRYVGAMQERVRLSLGGGRFVEDPFAQVAVARASSEIDASVLQTERNVAALWDLARRGEELPMALRLRARRDQVRATERALEAIDLLFKTAGGASLARGNRIERAWRDAHAAGVHVANEPERALALYGRGVFGLPVEDTLV
ncbi:3-hydroxy-9,10-secoandrosta-1,3,5(10)-triene-9,17-dione monooxygenase [Rhodococcus triatomae]|uniref:3-hydroxy-9,10-secoandrosta-1,3,5(10)-triene-9,17-dione monooxygenase n=1 Tax=Rhodococcus triatomae TaxID=300028 RepID=A0A1G7ZVR9_9NOCA|nr:3-hydroxy-9,10-secoandrosta-1,3,5(10)-triene-9,17-dione monooxygenase [Rhodococcus triatomae]